MPSDLNDAKDVSAPSHFYDERKVGFWKSKTMYDAQRMDKMLAMPSSKSVAPSPLESTIWAQDMKLCESYQTRDLKENVGVGIEVNKAPWKPLDHALRSSSNFIMQPESYSLEGKRIDINGSQYESSLFSCSLSETFSRKMRLSGNTLRPPPSNTVAFCYEKESVESLKEIEVKTIGNLLPDEEDLFSGVTDGLECSTNAKTCDDVGDFDLFSSGGGLELEGNDRLCAMQKKSGFIGNMTSLNTKFDLSEPNCSLDEMKFQSQYIPSFNPHSLPEIHDRFASDSPYNSSNIIDLAGSVGPRVIERINNRHAQAIGTNGHPNEFNGGVFGPSGNMNCPPHGHQYLWSNSSSYQHHPPSPVMWSNSPSFATSIHAPRFQQIPGFPRAPPHMLNTASPVYHHVGSAPTVNPSMWNRAHIFSGESPEASNFHLGSLGNAVFAGGSPLHPMEIACRTIFPHASGNYLDMTLNTDLHSPQQMRHIFPSGSQVMSMQAPFGSPNEHARSFSYRRNEASSNHGDKKQYELDVNRIMCGEDTRTTLMIKNIPNKYTSKMLLAAIDEHCCGSYDFIYLPIDFKNKCNVGYAFINMVDPQKIIPFYQALNGKKWEKFNSEKVACLAYARIQGKAALIAHFQNSSLMNEDKRCRPILFHTAGPNAGDQEPFPMGTSIRSRPGKPRSRENEDSHHEYLFTFGDGEESSNRTDSSSDSLKNSN